MFKKKLTYIQEVLASLEEELAEDGTPEHERELLSNAVVYWQDELEVAQEQVDRWQKLSA